MIAGRTGPPAATKRTSAFAHAVVVWLRRKVPARMAHGDRGENSREIRNPILFGMARYKAALVQEWYYRAPEMSSNKLNGRLPRTYCPARAAGYFSRMTEQLTDPLPELERAVAERPDDAKALVALANHYWLIGAGYPLRRLARLHASSLRQPTSGLRSLAGAQPKSLATRARRLRGHPPDSPRVLSVRRSHQSRLSANGPSAARHRRVFPRETGLTRGTLRRFAPLQLQIYAGR